MSVVLFILVMVSGVMFAVIGKKLTIPAAVTGAVLCTSIFVGVGWSGVILMTAFFVLGTIATSWKKNVKEIIGLAQPNQGRRNAGQVLANGGAGGILGFLAFIFPAEAPLFLYLLAAAFSSAAADTISSELGSVYGKRFYDILSFRQVNGGPDGVISVEGVLFGVMASTVIAAVYGLCTGFFHNFLWIIVGGSAGNLADSFLGATLERKHHLGNDAVNFLNTCIAVAVGYFLLLL